MAEGGLQADANGSRNGETITTFNGRTTYSLQNAPPPAELYEDLVIRHAQYGELSDLTLAKRDPNFQGILYSKKGAECLIDKEICKPCKSVYTSRTKTVHECVLSLSTANRLGLPEQIARKSMTVDQYMVTDAFALRRCHAIQCVPDLYLVYTNGKMVFIFMEFIEGGNFKKMEVNRWNLRDRKTLCQMLVSALSEIHRLGIVHYDLKPSNLMVSQGENSPNLHIIDFGSSKMYGFPYIVRNHSLTNTTPEMDTYTSYEEKVKKIDVYQLGLVILFIETGCDRLFLEKLANNTRGRDIARKEYIEWIKSLTKEHLAEFLRTNVNNYARERELTNNREILAKMLGKMLSPNPDARPSLKDILDDEYFRQVP